MRITVLFFCLLLPFISLAQTVERGFVSLSEGGRMYYEAEGSGEPVVLLHGHTLDLRMWDPQMDSLRTRYRVIRPELRGYGHSSRLADGMHSMHVLDVITLLDSLHLDRVHVVGLSMGSFVASELVALFPERLLSATLASGNIRHMPGPSTPIDSAELAASQQRVAEVQAQGGIDAWKRDWVERLVSGGGSRRESIRQSVAQQVADWDAWQLTHHEWRMYYADEAWDTLRVRCPQVRTLILSGEMEHKSVPNPMLKYLPNGRQEVIPDCGHMSNMEQPEAFTHWVIANIENRLF